jgi:hypothetical protein
MSRSVELTLGEDLARYTSKFIRQGVQELFELHCELCTSVIVGLVCERWVKNQRRVRPLTLVWLVFESLFDAMIYTLRRGWIEPAMRNLNPAVNVRNCVGGLRSLKFATLIHTE